MNCPYSLLRELNIILQIPHCTVKNIYLLKDLARASGYSTYTLKYYLRVGLLQEIGRGPETNFRYFDDSSVEKLKKIRTLRPQNVSLKEISLKLHQNDELLYHS